MRQSGNERDSQKTTFESFIHIYNMHSLDRNLSSVVEEEDDLTLGKRKRPHKTSIREFFTY